MSTVITGLKDFPTSKNVILIKGASERVLEACSSYKRADGKIEKLTDQIKSEIRQKLEDMGKQALRVIGIAVNYDGGLLKDLNDGNKKKLLSDFDQYKKYESDGTFLGFIGIMDPLRPEVAPAVERCKTAGI